MVTRPAQERSRRTARRNGFTYLWVLAAIAVMGVGLLAISEVWTTIAKRQKVEELEWIGAQFTAAIGSYYQSSPGLKSYPRSLQDLLEDRRFVVLRRHLRIVYRSPFTGTRNWDVITAADGSIKGVRVVLPDAAGVREFVYVPGVTAP